MKRLFALLLAFALILGSFPMQAFAEETEPTATTEATEPTVETTVATEPPVETTAATEVPTEEPVTEPIPVTVTGIAVAALPSKTVYQVGEPLDLTGGSVSVSYSDGTALTVGMTAEMVSGFNNTAAFTQTLTVAYEGFEAYFDVTVTASTSSNQTETTDATEATNATEPSVVSYAVPASEKEISWIELTSEPTKIQYVVNQDELDVTGGVITVYYTDGSTENVDVTVDMITNFDNTYVHTRYLSIRFGEDWTSYKVAIVESADKPLVMNWRIDMGNSKTTYYQYESLELDGVTLTLDYSNETTETVNVTSDMVTDFDTSHTGYYSFGIKHNDTTYWQGYNVITTDMLSGTCGENITWRISDSGVLRISGSGKIETITPDWYLEIPWDDYKSLIKTIVIENGITSIGQSAFADCNRLTSVELPSTLTEIGYGALYECTSLTTINFPQSLTDINQEAFYGCSSLTEITFPKKIDYLGSESFGNCTNLRKITFECMESPSAWDAFEGVTATGYYPGTTYWDDWFFENCGGEIEWIATGAAVDSITFEFDGATSGLIGRELGLYVTGNPGYIGIDCEFSVDNDVVKIVSTSNNYCTVIAKNAGTATVTAKDKRSGCTATTIIEIAAPKEISYPYEETITSNTGGIEKEYIFTPQETGTYVLSSTIDESFMAYGSPFRVSKSDDEGDFVLEPEYNSLRHDNKDCSSYYLQEGTTYKIRLEYYVGAGGPGMVIKTQTTFRLTKPTDVTGIEIVGGDRIEYGAVGERIVSAPIYVKLSPDNAVIDGDIVWESSNPGLIDIKPNDDAFYHVETYGEGSAVITAKYGKFSDSITVTTKKPEKLEIDIPTQVELKQGEEAWYAFTPNETGRYALQVDRDAENMSAWFEGKYQPQDSNSVYSELKNIEYGSFTAGVTYYLRVYTYGYIENTCSATLTISKEEIKPTAMVLHCPYGDSGSHMYFEVAFIPSNSYDKIVSWESSNTDVLNNRYSHSGTNQTFNIYGSGEVTITAISESGLRASCTVTVGQCYNGHTYGPWKQTKAKTCTIDGQETATCICGLRKYQPIPATGHNYDNNCDTECSDCGATRAAEHDFTGNWLYSETVHWHNCVNCGERSQIQNHIPGAAATQDAPQTCTECGYVIKGALGHSHSYGTELTVDETGHWYACSGCSARKNYNAHNYTNVCDADCNDCGYTRKNVHVSGGTWVSDKAGHWQSCTKCNTKLDYAAHVPGAAATAKTPQICSICRYEIQKATGSTTTNTVTNTIYQTVTKPSTSNHTHKYSDMLTLDEVGHWYACSGCTSKKEYAKHKFVNDCDADCDTCGYTRAVSHATEANWSADGTGHWYSCKDCGEKVGFASHQAENGNCIICGHPATGGQIPSATTTMAEPNAVAATESGNSTVMDTTTTEVATKSESAGIPWWMMIVAGVVSSAGTLGIVAIVIWINRKKIVAMFMGK